MTRSLRSFDMVQFGPYRATCDRVVDGDTLVLFVDLGFDVFRLLPVRLSGVNAPEHNTPRGKDATKFLIGLVGDREHPSPTDLLVAGVGRERSFARYVCDVCLTDGSNLAAMVIAAGHGVPFDPNVDVWKRGTDR